MAPRRLTVEEVEKLTGAKIDKASGLFDMEDEMKGSPSTTGRIRFAWADVERVIAETKKQGAKFIYIVHDDGTYLMPKKGGSGVSARPIEGGWEAGHGDDFGEKIPLRFLESPKLKFKPKELILNFTATQMEMTLEP